MITEIKWLGNKETTAQGRNGLMKCVGIEILSDIGAEDDYFHLSPINTKGIGNCFIDVPIADIDMLCWVLQEGKKRVMRDQKGGRG